MAKPAPYPAKTPGEQSHSQSYNRGRGVMASNPTRSHMAGVEEAMDSITQSVVGDTPAETRPNNSAMYVNPWDTYPTIARTNPVAVVVDVMFIEICCYKVVLTLFYSCLCFNNSSDSFENSGISDLSTKFICSTN